MFNVKKSTFLKKVLKICNELKNRSSYYQKTKTRKLESKTKRQEKTRKQKREAEEKVMKTKNNVQKAITKSLAVIISLVLLSFTVNAQDFWKSVLKNNSFTQIAMAMTNETSGPAHYETSSLAASTFSELFETEAEPALSLDSWMTDDALFAGLSEMVQPEADSEWELESWMMDDNTFKVRFFVVIEEKDEALQLESWMVDSKVWN